METESVLRAQVMLLPQNRSIHQNGSVKGAACTAGKNYSSGLTSCRISFCSLSRQSV